MHLVLLPVTGPSKRKGHALLLALAAALLVAGCVSAPSGAAGPAGSPPGGPDGEDPGSPDDPAAPLYDTCFADFMGSDYPLPDYDAAGATIGSHCLGTDHQDIAAVERVVFCV